MAMFAPIPLPTMNNDVFKDVMDYLEEIQKRKALTKQSQAKLVQDQNQFEIRNKLEQQKLAEMQQSHQSSLAQNKDIKSLQMDLLKQKIDELKNPNKKMSAQERTQAMKLLEAGRSIQSMTHKAHKLSGMLEDNPNLTGWVPGALSAIGKPGEDLGSFSETAGKLQADIARYGSQRGGAQALKWAEKVKPSNWKDVASNKGMVNSMIEDAKNDYEEVKNEYEALTGQPYPIQMPKMKAKMVEITNKKTGEKKQVSLEEARKMGVSGV